MKTIKLLLIAMISPFLFASCTADVIVEDNYAGHYVDNGISLPQLMEGYNLWYVDYDATTGNGDVPFLTRAFTISFLHGDLYANNNLAGIGVTGDGFGIRVGYYDYFSKAIRVYHDVYGAYDLEVYQLAANRIKLYDRRQNTAYYLNGYQRSAFDYNKLFNDNIHYFLQEYKAWEKVYTSNVGALNDFDHEHFLQFMAGGSDNNFRSSQDAPGTNVNNIYWDFTGLYGVYNTSNPYTKILTLDYDFWGNESFTLSVINDSRIRLYHNASGTTYEFVGRGFIQYLRQSAVRSKSDTTLRKEFVKKELVK
ncbi:nicotinic acid mononucleotide adenyltransferase [Flavobacterium amnicola]|uniref:Nicotinic acid mononucleotide adenyltransferase n=1 Tax=Flavobacterium amnicola TaxID=2506422 RepID=A0A4Q1K5J1_9FLAO|nr:nicotinic acid mononucleotide adenyltransferase [Flavobacterium amnicola]RXR20862.1 nicotinic acid mononucleotide adenyltransferase [Flavobacterium amnicola]